MKRIVILGGGYGGIAAAKKLAKIFKKNNDIEITIVDKNTYHTLMTELHEVAGSRVDPDSVMVSYERIFANTKVKVITDFITGIDFEKKALVSEKAKYPYDYLILGTGGAPEFFDIQGIQENSFSLWSLEDAIRIRQHIEERFRLAAKEPDPEQKKQMLTFVVAGAGFTGIELAGELMERRDVLCARYHIDPRDVRIIVVEAMDRVLPIIEEPLRKKTEKYMRKHGIEIMLKSPIVAAEENLVILQSGESIKTETFVWTCGIHGSEFTSRIPLEKGHTARGECSIASEEGIHGMSGCRFEEDETYIVGKRGRILVNNLMQTADYHDIYAVGDNLWFVEEGKVLPQIVETALQTGECAAENIAADIQSKDKKAFKSNYHGFMVSIGGRYCVSNAGGIKLSGFFAMAMKHMVNLHYLFGLAGINACWAYLKHEFFHMEDKRTLIGGHLSYRMQGFWAVPLRMWLGLMWLVEGVNKIGEGWLNFSAGTKSGWMFSKGVTQAGVKAAADAATAATGAAGDYAADAATAATGAADAAAEAVTAATGAAADYASDAVSAATGAVADTAAEAVSAATGAVSAAADSAHEAFGLVWDTAKSIIPYDSGFVTWFREIFMDSMAAYIPYQLFQVMVVGVEVLIGLALIGGLFTFPAAGVSIIMCFVFIFSGMFSWSQLWFIFAAIVMLGGAGRSFGLDHYVLPFLGRKWRSISLVQRYHLYGGEPVNTKKKR
ncbi:FAD-dependent oxidoreductase [Marispirochaeta aestuarii]|uniref:FAD-dependent oxidoreductase n=1 Tax=Marispirochaeta aestuarii TaxID=1963862 RepID=UPI002ABE89FA|nr:FAD-dependent oxidoreductase [Marispirochaeta aestuarii]